MDRLAPATSASAPPASVDVCLSAYVCFHVRGHRVRGSVPCDYLFLRLVLFAMLVTSGLPVPVPPVTGLNYCCSGPLL
jgi:hypothetical protein